MSDMEKDRMDIDREGIFDDDAVNEAAQETAQKAAADAVVEKVMPIQEKYNAIIASGRINEILDAGRDYSIKIAAEKYEKVRKAVGFGRI